MVDTVKVGDTFSAPHADSQLTFTVTEVIGRKAVLAKSEPSPDWGVVERAFTRAEAIAAMQWQETMRAIGDQNAAFWATVTEPGQVLHYHNGFGEYVRCVVNHELQLQPVALVGNWANSHADFYIEKIVGMNGAWRPHYTTVFEAPDFVAPRHKDAPRDPRGLSPLGWRRVPEAAGVVRKWELIKE